MFMIFMIGEWSLNYVNELGYTKLISILDFK